MSEEKSLDELVGELFARLPKTTPSEIERRLERRLRSEHPVHDPDPPRNSNRFWEAVTAPAFILALLVFLSSGAVGTGTYIISQKAHIDTIDRDVVELKRSREADSADTARIRSQWLPRIEGVERDVASVKAENGVQNQRLENIIDAVKETRKNNSDIMAEINKVRVDIATLLARVPEKRAALGPDER